MTELTGTRALIRLIMRRDRLKLGTWIVLQALVVVGVAVSFAQLYPTVESRQPLALTLMANPALSSLLGPLHNTSIGALTAWRIGVFISALIALISSLLVVRHTRTEEETGRRELLGATVVGRQAGLAAATIVVIGTNLSGGVLLAACLIGFGLPFAGSLGLGLSFAAVGSTFAATAAVAAQLTVSARAARGIAIVVLGLSFLLRFLGDAQPTGMAWLSWLSPIGWAQQVRPFAAENWQVFALFIAASAILGSAACVLSARRDLGAGVLAVRSGRATASAALHGPFTLAWRLQSGGLTAWAVAFVLAGLMLGSVANSIADIVNTSSQMKDLIARLVGEGSLIDGFFTEMMSIAGLVSAAYATQSALRLRSEEEGLRAELVLATAVGRVRWALSHLMFAVIGPVILLGAIGSATGIAYALGAGETSRHVARAVGAAMAQLPAVWLVAALAVALYGLLPRLAGVIWPVLVAFLLLGQLGQVLQLSRWVLELSPFTHVPKVLIGEPAAMSVVWLLAVAAALMSLGLTGFRRRDIGRV